MNRWLLYAIVLIAASAVLLIIGDRLLRPEVHISENQARTFAEQELAFRHPDAAIRIYDAVNQSDQWIIRAEVSEGKHSTCPNLTLVELRYPQFGFVPRERQITANCEVLGCRGNPTCPIAYEEEAILVAQEPLRIHPTLQTFLASNSNVSATASFHSSYLDSNANATYSDVWIVDWRAESATLRTILNKTGGATIEAYLLQ